MAAQYLPHTHPDGTLTPGGGLWLDDEFLWDLLPRLTPMATYIYIALGRYQAVGQYPTARDLSEETTRPLAMVQGGLQKLYDCGLLNTHDMARLWPDWTPPKR